MLTHDLSAIKRRAEASLPKGLQTALLKLPRDIRSWLVAKLAHDSEDIPVLIAEVERQEG